MSRNTWVELVSWASADGTALTNTVTSTLILPASARATLPANFFDTPGRTLRMKARGRISNIVTTPGTLSLFARFGAVNVASFGAMNLNVVAKTNVSWQFECDLVCRTIGSGTAATMFGMGLFQSESLVGSPANTAGGNGSLVLPVSAPAVGAGFDSTAAQQVDLFAQWSIANAGNSIQVHQYTLEALN